MEIWMPALINLTIGFIIGTLISKLYWFRTNRSFRILSYILCMPLLLFFGFITMGDLLQLDNPGTLAGLYGAIGVMWFYIGTRTTKIIKTNIGRKVKIVLGVLYILGGTLAISQTGELIDYNLVNLNHIFSITQIIFGILLIKKPPLEE